MVFVIRPNQLGGNRCNYCYPTNTNTTLILYTSLNSTAASSPWTPAGNPEVGHHLVCVPPHPGPTTQDPALHKHDTKCKQASKQVPRHGRPLSIVGPCRPYLASLSARPQSMHFSYESLPRPTMCLQVWWVGNFLPHAVQFPVGQVCRSARSPVLRSDRC